MADQAPSKAKRDVIAIVPKDIAPEITEADVGHFFNVISTDISTVQKARIIDPDMVLPRQESVLAVHWHPEHVPLDLIEKRMRAMFPNCKHSLIIPTQHNLIEFFGDFAGVEVDCYSSGFNQKVQLLLHFNADALKRADVLKKMLAHTFKYRSSQLFDFIRTITRPDAERLDQAVRQTGANEALVGFVQVVVRKIETLLDKHAQSIPPMMIKNKILRNFFDCLRPEFGDAFINRVQTFLAAVKAIVKAGFSLKYFYRTSEIIEEARSLNAGIVIPHPEQFWPILLADYDVDGYEVWNPQSLRYTGFLIDILHEKNKRMGPSQRPLLVFMGDDTHMGEKVKDPRHQDPIKASREIGIQPGWEDPAVCKKLILANMDRLKVIEEYKNRLAG